jgi:hypothetical protein
VARQPQNQPAADTNGADTLRTPTQPETYPLFFRSLCTGRRCVSVALLGHLLRKRPRKEKVKTTKAVTVGPRKKQPHFWLESSEALQTSQTHGTPRHAGARAHALPETQTKADNKNTGPLAHLAHSARTERDSQTHSQFTILACRVPLARVRRQRRRPSAHSLLWSP